MNFSFLLLPFAFASNASDVAGNQKRGFVELSADELAIRRSLHIDFGIYFSDAQKLV